VASVSGYGAFIDVTSGNNQFNLEIPTPSYSAGLGYNNATGIGVPLGMPFARGLCPNRVAAFHKRARLLPTALVRATSYSLNVTPKVRGILDQGRKAASDEIRIQLVLIPGFAIANDEQRVVATLRSAGLSIAKTFKNHLVVDATGPSSAVERLFATQIDNVAQGSVARYMPVTATTVPASLAPYISGVSLDDIIISTMPRHSAMNVNKPGVKLPANRSKRGR
jgi:hypothetical protein